MEELVREAGREQLWSFVRQQLWVQAEGGHLSVLRYDANVVHPDILLHRELDGNKKRERGRTHLPIAHIQTGTRAVIPIFATTSASVQQTCHNEKKVATSQSKER